MKTSLFSFLCLFLLMMSCKENQNKPTPMEEEVSPPALKISLAEWSLNKPLFAGEMSNLEFAQVAADMGFTGIEYVNQFFADKAEDTDYLDSLNAAAQAAGVEQVLIMIDREGHLGALDEKERAEAVENHKKWVVAAKHLGCHSIRVNAYGEGTAEEVADAAVDGLGALAEYAKDFGINIIVENHGGHSSNGEWLTGVMDRINMDNCGTLPDFGNFCIRRDPEDPYGKPCLEEYDKYKGVKEMMKHAKAVSAKSHNFDKDGNERDIDYGRMIEIVKEAGYTGYIGVEYEGSELTPKEGILATKALIERYL